MNFKNNFIPKVRNFYNNSFKKKMSLRLAILAQIFTFVATLAARETDKT